MTQYWIMLILFSATLHDDYIQEFDARWDEMLFSMTKIPSDDILESLYKLRISESDQRKTVTELYDIQSSQTRGGSVSRTRNARGRSQ